MDGCRPGAGRVHRRRRGADARGDPRPRRPQPDRAVPAQADPDPPPAGGVAGSAPGIEGSRTPVLHRPGAARRPRPRRRRPPPPARSALRQRQAAGAPAPGRRLRLLRLRHRCPPARRAAARGRLRDPAPMRSAGGQPGRPRRGRCGRAAGAGDAAARAAHRHIDPQRGRPRPPGHPGGDGPRPALDLPARDRERGDLDDPFPRRGDGGAVARLPGRAGLMVLRRRAHQPIRPGAADGDDLRPALCTRSAAPPARPTRVRPAGAGPRQPPGGDARLQRQQQGRRLSGRPVVAVRRPSSARPRLRRGGRAPASLPRPGRHGVARRRPHPRGAPLPNPRERCAAGFV